MKLQITQVSAENFKIGNFTFRLGPINYFVGPNGKGKTSVLDAIQFAFTGEHSRRGKQNQSLMRLSNGRGPLMAETLLSDGLALRRTLTAHGDSIKYSESPGCKKVEFPAVLVNSDDYFRKGDIDRVRAVMAIGLGKTEITAGSLRAKVKNIRLDDNNEASEAAIDEICNEIMDSDEARQSAKQSVLDWLGALVADMIERRRTWKQEVEKHTKTVEGLTQTQTGRQVARNVETELEDARARLNDLNERHGKHGAELEKWEKVAADRKRITTAINDLAESVKQVSAIEARLKELRAKAEGYASKIPAMEETKKGLEARRDPTAADVKRTTEHHKKIAAEFGTREGIETSLKTLEKTVKGLAAAEKAVAANEKLVATKNDLMALTQAYTTARQAWDNSTRDIEGIESEIGALNQQIKDETEAAACPHCGGKHKDWRTKALKELNGKLSERTEQLRIVGQSRAKLLAAKDAADNAWTAGKDLEQKINAARRETSTLSSDLNRIRQAQESINSLTAELERLPKQADLEKATEEKDAAVLAHGKLAKEMQECLEKIAFERLVDDRMDEVQTGIKTLEGQLETIKGAPATTAQLRKQLDELGTPHVLEEADARVNSRAIFKRGVEAGEVAVQNLETQHKTWLAAKATESNKATAIKERDKAEAQAMIANEVVKILETEQRDVVKGAFDAILLTANRLAGDILPSKLEYHDGQIGFWKESRFVEHDLMCGAEQTACYAAISLALAVKSPVKLVVVDEIGRMTKRNQVRFLALIKQALADGIIDQFIATQAFDEGEKLPVFLDDATINVITL